MSILTIYDIVLLTVNEQSWNSTLTYIFQLYLKRIKLKFTTIFLRQL